MGDTLSLIYDNPLNLTKAPDQFEDELPCGNNIQPSLYAIDVFIPAIDLHQESQCEISTRDSAVAWRWAKALYSLMGWLVTSLMILTVSGILRRQVEGT
ncbi:hypothetical protein OVA03_11015 [Asticcacaulis sp. SL142]|uniref:hypothetical protein n=1 Tax=Asticcacaulis sp. SL142 TaxID=2995155 RepID=UPI00226C80E0|nr:hypothetical protein [Asticcacaulis sp. SL142]WAC47235.1 hypothetical protein OVA03_11015 [Asticcacaulis sp. SL142]